MAGRLYDPDGECKCRAGDSNDVKGARGWREGGGRKMGCHLFVTQSGVMVYAI